MKKLQAIIRPAEPTDAREINILRRMPGVAENIMSLPSETVISNERFVAQQAESRDDHLFCAEVLDGEDKRVIGIAGLHVQKIVRQRHSATLGIMVHKEFQGRGIGAQLMHTLIDLADNWLILMRVDLTVYPDNESAIRLYEKFGFVREGIMKYAAIRAGQYSDVVRMARYHKSLER